MEHNLTEVTQAIKAHIPTDNVEVHRGLDSLISSAPYTAPELMNGLWGRLGGEVTLAVGDVPLTEDWKIQAVAVLMNKTADEIRELYGKK